VKKLLGIIVLGLMLGGNANANCIKGNCENGYGEFSWKGLGIYKGEWLNSKMHGFGEYEGYPDGSHAGLTYKGYYKKDKKHGDGKFTSKRYSFEGEYRKNKLKLGKLTWPNGRVFEGKFVHGKIKLGRNIWPNGNICEEYTESKKYGPQCFVNIIKKNNSLNSNNTDSNSVDSNSTDSNSADSASLIDQAKETCKSLGFKEGTEKFADCSLKLYSQSLEKN
jgi:hypothetical protein